MEFTLVNESVIQRGQSDESRALQSSIWHVGQFDRVRGPNRIDPQADEDRHRAEDTDQKTASRI
jgi:hypothetical protein